MAFHKPVCSKRLRTLNAERLSSRSLSDELQEAQTERKAANVQFVKVSVWLICDDSAKFFFTLWSSGSDRRRDDFNMK